MKKIYTLFVALIFSGSLMAQTPQSFKYQAVARDASGDVVADQAAGMQISILQGSTSGTTVYVETFTPTTNEFGLINLNIGAGTVVSGDLTTIDWSADTYFMKIEMDITGGTTYEEYGTSQLLSVPYALHAKTAANIFSGNYSDLSGAPINVSTFTNDAGYLTSITETDAVYGASQAANITATDITNLGNLSGINTGDQTITLTGNVTGSGTGSFATTIADKAVTLAKIEDMATNSLIYRKTAGTGAPEVQTLATLKTDLGLTGTNSGDQTSIVGITGTLAEFNTALTGADFATGGGTVTGTNTGDQDLSTLALKSNVLELDNTTVFTPDADYEPATKKYVDDNAPTTYSVGDFAQGGIVFWVDETGQHGLVCAKTDQSTGVRWYAGTYGNTQAKGDGPFSGEANTSIIIVAQVAIGDDGSTYAARICNELQITEGGKTYGDWYLPSKGELNLMYQNKSTIDATAGANGGSAFASNGYWSSTEYDNINAQRQSFGSGLQGGYLKGSAIYVRSVRAF